MSHDPWNRRLDIATRAKWSRHRRKTTNERTLLSSLNSTKGLIIYASKKTFIDEYTIYYSPRPDPNFSTYRNVLLDAAAGEYAVQTRSQFALRQQREYHRFADYVVHAAAFAVRLAVQPQQHFARIIIAGDAVAVRQFVIWKFNMIQPVAQSAAVINEKSIEY